MPSRTPHRRGYTLLELVVSSVLMVTVLVPAMALVTQGIEYSGDAEVRALLTTACVSKMEEHLAIAAASFSEATVSGDFSSDGNADMRFSVVRTTSAGAGGITDRLMVITVVVWYDEDQDDVQDSAEATLTLSTKVAAMAIYQELANA
jgi:Tfp pilus assembly protein PilE